MIRIGVGKIGLNGCILGFWLIRGEDDVREGMGVSLRVRGRIKGLCRRMRLRIR